MSPEILLILLIFVSFVISLYGSLVGFGGGIFMVPILITIFHYPLHLAVGSCMISLVGSALISTYYNRKNSHVDFKMGILLEIPTMIGVVVGSLLLSYIAAEKLEYLFAVMVFLLGLSFFIKFKKRDENKESFFSTLNKVKPRMVIKNHKNFVAYRVSVLMVIFFGSASGILAGLFGVGGGFMKTPIMLKVFKIPPKIATATALFMIIITGITGSVSHYLQGHIEFTKAWPVMLGFALGALGSKQINTHLKDKTLEKMIGGGLLVAAIVMTANFLYNH
ncbi:sulfite exporter TauE/SafE family protein [Halpernia sp.]|uniref:sulfite exporter TauE/SafE family protein n=1 Tax=Halpernia sp. TaxID=2782209 RepID=UPI003A95829D